MPAVQTQLADLKSVEGEELITSANPEGVVSVAPKTAPEAPLTVVSGYAHSGLGGPLAVEIAKDRGICKALGGDGVFELSNGGKYVLPLELATAIGAAIPDPPVALDVQRREWLGLAPETKEEKEERERRERNDKDVPKPGVTPRVTHTATHTSTKKSDL